MLLQFTMLSGTKFMPEIRSKGKYDVNKLIRNRLLRTPLPMGASSMITGSFHFSQQNTGNSSDCHLRHTTVMTQAIACTPQFPVLVPVQVAILPKKTLPLPGVRISSTLAMVSVHEHCKLVTLVVRFCESRYPLCCLQPR